MQSSQHPNGLTVAELKRIVKDLPETDRYGNAFEVWVETGDSKTSPVTAVEILNLTAKGSDILFASNVFRKD